MSLLSTAARTVTDWMKLGFPEEVAKRIVSGELPMDKASRMKRAKEQGYEDGFYKGMYPYDWTKENGNYKGPVISEINRQSSFPSFGGTDGDVDIAGFMTKDPEVANRFANPNLMQSGAVFPLMKRSNAEHVIDAAGANAGDIQFGESGMPFRDAVRSGEYDTVKIQNTADEGDVYVALDPSMIRSTNAAFDPQYKGANILGNADPRLLAGIAAGGGGVSAATALSNKLAAAQAVKEQGDIRAPNSSLLHDFTMGARDLERRLEGSPASLLFPEGLVEYLEQANRAERPNAATRSWALLDFL